MDKNRYQGMEALHPFYEMMEGALSPYVDGHDFFEYMSQDLVFEFPFPLPGSPTRYDGPESVRQQFLGFGSVLWLDSMSDLVVHKSDEAGDITVLTLEYASHGKSVITNNPYNNRYVSIVSIKDRRIFNWRDHCDQMVVLNAVGGLEPVIAQLKAGQDA